MNTTSFKLSEILFRQNKHCFTLLILIISLDASALEIHPLTPVIQDSLVIKKSNGKRTYVVKKNREIKIWSGKSTIRGRFIELANDELSMSQNGTISTYNLDDISKIKIFENIERNIIGSALKLWGGALIVAGIVPPITLGPGGFIISIPAWAIGYGMLKVGDLIIGNRKLNLKKNWQIQ